MCLHYCLAKKRAKNAFASCNLSLGDSSHGLDLPRWSAGLIPAALELPLYATLWYQKNDTSLRDKIQAEGKKSSGIPVTRDPILFVLYLSCGHLHAYSKEIKLLGYFFSDTNRSGRIISLWKGRRAYLCLALLVNVTKKRTSCYTSIHVRAGPQLILLPAMADSRDR